MFLAIWGIRKLRTRDAQGLPKVRDEVRGIDEVRGQSLEKLENDSEKSSLLIPVGVPTSAQNAKLAGSSLKQPPSNLQPWLTSL